MSRDRLGAAWAGLALIGLGIAFLLAQWIGWDRVWPIFPLFGGLAALVSYVAGGLRDEGLVFVGTAATLVGLFFFGFTLGIWQWDQMAELWPVFVLIGGISFIALFFAQRRRRDPGTLGVGCAAIVVGIAGLAITFGFLSGDLVRYWPLLIIMIGIFALLGALYQGLRRE
jgi:hypothetical protein